MPWRVVARCGVLSVVYARNAVRWSEGKQEGPRSLARSHPDLLPRLAPQRPVGGCARVKCKQTRDDAHLKTQQKPSLGAFSRAASRFPSLLARPPPPMPILRKKGALFAVYHDSPDKVPPSPSTHKKDVLSGRSPTTRSKTKGASASGIKAGMGSVRPLAAAASAALQAHTGLAVVAGTRKAFGSVGAHAENTLGARKAGAGAGVKDLDQENLRAGGVAKVSGKMQVFQDEQGTGKPAEGKPRPRRALGSKPTLGAQASSTIPPTHHSNALRILPTPALTIFHDPPLDPIRGQENIPPSGADREHNRSPAVRRSTRKTIATPLPHPRPVVSASSARQHDSGWEDSGSPYIAKPRLRKLKSTQHVDESPRTAHTLAASSQPASLILGSSQPHSEAYQPSDSSSPLVTRPQTRKPVHTASSTKHRPTTRHPSAYSVPADPILCDVSEAYGADPSAQPLGFRSGGATAAKEGAGRMLGVRRDGESASIGRGTGLRPSVRFSTRAHLGPGFRFRATLIDSPRPIDVRLDADCRGRVSSAEAAGAASDAAEQEQVVACRGEA